MPAGDREEGYFHRGHFRGVITGVVEGVDVGHCDVERSLPAILAKALLAPGAPAIDYAKWHLFFADERVVPLDHAESNYRLVRESLLGKLPVEIPANQIHPLAEKYLQDVHACAREYEEQVRRWVEINGDQSMLFLDPPSLVIF